MIPVRGVKRRARAMDILTSSVAFCVAASGSAECTQEHWSRILASSKRYGFSPASRSVSRNSGSCVRGVQEATTMRLSRCSCIMSRMLVRLVSEQVYMVWVAKTTFGCFGRDLRHALHVHHRGDVLAAVADEDADPRLFVGDIMLVRVDLLW